MKILIQKNASEEVSFFHFFILLSDFIRKYLAEKLPEALPYAKAIESDVVKMLKTVDLSEKMEYPPTANQNSAKKLQKRDLRSQFPQPAVKDLEDYVRTYLAENFPSALPYADLIQNDVLAILGEMRELRMSSMRSDASGIYGRWRNGIGKRSGIRRQEPKHISLEDFIRKTLAAKYPQYLPQVKEIKEEIVQILRELKLMGER